MQTKINPLRRNRLASLMLEASPAAIVLTDSRRIIEAANRLAEKWFGYREADLVGQPINRILLEGSASDNASHQACFLSQLSDPDANQVWLLQGLRKDNSTFAAQVTFYPLVTLDGDARLVNVVDLTRQLAHHEKQIEGERLAAVLQMVSGLAHESRNALQRAQSCLDLLQLDLGQQSELLDLTDRIQDALQDIHRNYEEVKQYAAPITVKRTTFDLVRLCQSTFDEMTQRVGESAPQLTIHCNAACHSVKLDRNRIQEVLHHVLENAIHVSPRDGVIEFHCDCPSEDSKSDIQIQVRDHGAGLTDEVEKRIFEPFFTTKLHGTGLGMAVCRRIIDAHRGTIRATNHPDGGTVVQIVLPACLSTESTT